MIEFGCVLIHVLQGHLLNDLCCSLYNSVYLKVQLWWGTKAECLGDDWKYLENAKLVFRMLSFLFSFTLSYVRNCINQKDRVKLSQGLHLSNFISLKAVKGDIQNVYCCVVSKEGVILRVKKNPNNVLS